MANSVILPFIVSLVLEAHPKLADLLLSNILPDFAWKKDSIVTSMYFLACCICRCKL
jgi:hypothetical protein